MKNVQGVWVELQRMGFQGNITTLEELYTWLRRVSLTFTPPLLKPTSNGFLNVGDLTYSEFTLAMSGNFGSVYLVYREKGDDGSYVFLKTSAKHPQALLLEGILQSISHTVLLQHGFPYAIPRVMDIVRHPDSGIVFSTQRIPGSQLFADYLKDNLQWGIPCKANDQLVFQVIAQVATYTAILESALGFNHRDLKGTNVLMVTPTEAWEKTTRLQGISWTLRSSLQAILIDFGFACVGREGGKPVVSAGEYLPTVDFCPKEGRDLFLFFAGLWSVEVFRQSLTAMGKKLFHRWLRDTSETYWAEWLITAVQSNLRSMYLLTSADHFRSESSAPLAVLQDLSAAYPEILTVELLADKAKGL